MNRFKLEFDNWPVLDGFEYIVADLGAGVKVRAYVELDQFAKPGDNGINSSEECLEAYNADRLRFCELVLKVYIGGVCIEKNAANLCGIGIMEDDEFNGEYLTERANELLAEIDIPGIVAAFAKKATAAAIELGKGART